MLVFVTATVPTSPQPQGDPEIHVADFTLASRGMQVTSVSSIIAIAGLLVAQILAMISLQIKGLVPSNTWAWGFADVAYLLIVAALSVFLLVYASLPDDAQLPRTFLMTSLVIGVPAALFSLVLAWYRLIGSNADWKVMSTAGHLAIDLLPFALAMFTSIMMMRTDYYDLMYPAREVRMRRVQFAAIAVLVGAMAIGLAAWLPRLMYSFIQD